MKKIITLFFFMSIPTSAYANEVNVNNLGRIVDLDPKMKSSIGTGYFASKDTYGMRSNAVVAAFSANPQKPFDYPIVGFEGIMQMAKYKDRDSVTLYSDNSSPPFKLWEKISTALYTPTSFSSKGYDTSHLKAGMLIDTMHDPKWSSYIVSIHKDKVITSGWVNSRTGRLGTPENGIGLIVNPLTKIWAVNNNIFFPENGKAKNGVIQENGIINNDVKNPNAINGLDTVVLPQSRYGGTAAYLARSADRGGKQQWAYGFISQGAKSNFVSSNSAIHNPDVSFHDMSSAYYGILFDGSNKKSSIAWKNKSGTIVTAIDPEGKIESFSLKTKLVTNNSYVTNDYSRYLIRGNETITLLLPNTKSIIDGFTVKISKLSKGLLIIKAQPGQLINDGSNEVSLEGVSNKDLFFTNGNWYLL
ncbi:hypothetical protein M3B69_19735 [Raoultella ornithinolytica]|uniref:hypothetical protein n=1 Tax=Raoultella ornithinolytica TaxID=54291 RepID=UPI0021A7A462|nr:hypothetical protein [Raoultella ornithinolytica]MCT1682165.1 hypothetical protein [Raoultella ornithinolytica]MEB8213831.1 hypothetical protein [Raoultella ornithinolytica]HEC2597220.1 hypothetical protein [Raoultella ornithinolytica]